MKRSTLPPTPAPKFPAAGSKRERDKTLAAAPKKPVDLKTPPGLSETHVGSAHGPSIDELEQGLRWTGADITGAHENQADLFYQVAKRVAIVNGERDSAKLYLAQVEARVATELRDTAEAEKVKMTAAEVDQRVALDPEVQKIARVVLERTAEAAQLSALREAYVQRGYTIRDHILLQTQSGSAVDPANRLAEENRREMAQQRKDYRIPPRSTDRV